MRRYKSIPLFLVEVSGVARIHNRISLSKQFTSLKQQESQSRSSGHVKTTCKVVGIVLHSCMRWRVRSIRMVKQSPGDLAS